MTAVSWDSEHEVFVVTGFEEASAVLRSPGWSSDPRNGPQRLGRLDLPQATTILFMDPPEHTRLRGRFSPAFSARAIERLRPRIAAIIESALDGLDDETDLVADLAYLIPMAVMAELLDVGDEGAALFLEQTPRLVRMLELDAGADDFTESAAASTELVLFLLPLLSDRRQHPGDDFISGLLAQTDLAVEEVLSTCLLLLAAGHETTANLIGTGALALMDHPGQLPLLAADPARAVEELLRVEGPVKLAARAALTDHELGGRRIRAGQAVYVRIDAANRDARRWTDPDLLDLAREPVPHLAFGAGAHFCLGAALARLEAAETLVRLFARFPAMARTSDKVLWRDSTTFYGLRELSVRLGRRPGRDLRT